MVFTAQDSGQRFAATTLSVPLRDGLRLPQTDFAVLDGRVLMYDYAQWLYAYDPLSGELTSLLSVGPDAAAFVQDGEGRFWVLYNHYLEGKSVLKRFEGGVETGSFSCEALTEGSIRQAGSLFWDGIYLYLFDYGDELWALDISGEAPAPSFCMDTTAPMVEGAFTRILVNGAGTLFFTRADTTGTFYEILALDVKQKAWIPVECLDLGQRAFGVTPAAGNRFCLDDGEDVYLYDLDQGARTHCFNRSVDGIPMGSSLYGLADGSFLMLSRGSLLHLAPAAGEAGNAPQVLTLATWCPDPLLSVCVSNFNAGSEDVKIQLLDYAQYDDGEDQRAGLLRLSADLATGNTPDLFDLHSLPGGPLAAKGLLEDLYPYIDADEELARENFFPNILAALEQDAQLLRLVPAFGVMTFVGRGETLNGRTSWDLDEFFALLQTLPADVSALDGWITQNLFLEYALTFNGTLYVDWTTGACAFDSPEFIRLLEYAKTLPADSVQAPYMDESALLEGRQLLTLRYPSDVGYMTYLDQITGQDPCFVGFPSASGGGNAAVPYLELGLCSQSSNKDACWAFLRSLLLPEAQADMGCFPLDMSVFDRQAAAYALEAPDNSGPDAAALARSLVESVSRIQLYDETVYQILLEEAGAFFAGDKSAAETAAVVQSRVSTYVAEQKG